MEENKAKIARSFAEVLKMTAAYSELRDLTYAKADDDEFVLAEFQNGRTKKINVHWDSGIAMIHDIMRSLYLREDEECGN